MQKSNDTIRHRFASVWDAIEEPPEDAAMMKALSAERMRQEADGAQTPAQVKWNRENFVKGLAQDNQTTPLGTSVIEKLHQNISIVGRCIVAYVEEAI